VPRSPFYKPAKDIIVPPARKLRPEEAMAKIVRDLQRGRSIQEACAAAGKSLKSYEYYRKTRPEFANECDIIRAARKQGRDPSSEDLARDFPDFCERYLGHQVFWHQLQWVDLLEGREPRNLHPSQTYEKGQPNYLLINTPPEHAKSTSLTVDYVTYRICRNPNDSIMIISKTQTRAKEFLYAIKYRLTNPRYKKLQMAYSPAGLFKGSHGDDSPWQSDKIYLGHRDSSEKDPTVQAIGLGGQVYGARNNLIIVDDAVVSSNAHQFEQQISWLQREVITRPGPGGKVLVIGTRIDLIDLYRELRNGDRYPTGVSPWTYLAQPAVLDFAEDPKDWRTLWPRSDSPWPGLDDERGEDGLYPRWDGYYLSRRRSVLDTKTWALVYMQQEVAENSVFQPAKVRASVNGQRKPGIMYAGAVGHRERGMDGLYVICSMDPAMVGDTGCLVYAVDRATHRRYVLDVRVCTTPSPTWIREVIKELTDTYGANEWRIEKNAFQLFLVQDPEIQTFLATRGVKIVPHFTGSNKWDSSYGVASLSSLFEPVGDQQKALIELPSPKQSEAVKHLIEQLILWQPETKGKTDLVMALWFAEIAAREILGSSRWGSDHMRNPHLTRGAKRTRTVVNLAEYREAFETGAANYL
jgi:hypothetical protein